MMMIATIAGGLIGGLIMYGLGRLWRRRGTTQGRKPFPRA